jgi:exosortase/archaeosortase family protein
MTPQSQWIFLRTILILVVLGIIYFIFEAPVRHLEATAVVGSIRIFGTQNVEVIGSSYILVIPFHIRPEFLAYVSPSCSAFASALALIALGSVLPRRTPRRLRAIFFAVLTVVVGNLIRIGSSVVVGLYAGKDSLVLFHNWVGGTFTFVYTLGGFMIMLTILLPSKLERLEEAQHAVPA